MLCSIVHHSLLCSISKIFKWSENILVEATLYHNFSSTTTMCEHVHNYLDKWTLQLCSIISTHWACRCGLCWRINVTSSPMSTRYGQSRAWVKLIRHMSQNRNRPNRSYLSKQTKPKDFELSWCSGIKWESIDSALRWNIILSMQIEAVPVIFYVWTNCLSEQCRLWCSIRKALTNHMDMLLASAYLMRCVNELPNWALQFALLD